MSASVGGVAENLEGTLEYRVVETDVSGPAEGGLTLIAEGPRTGIHLVATDPGARLTDGDAEPGARLTDGEELRLEFAPSTADRRRASYATLTDGTRPLQAGTVALRCEDLSCTGMIELRFRGYLPDGSQTGSETTVTGEFAGTLRFVCESFEAHVGRYGMQGSPLAPGIPATAADPDLSTAFCSQFRHVVEERP